MSLFDIFFTAINAIFPVILLTILGFTLKNIGFLSNEFVKIGNKLVFNVCLPIMLFLNIYEINSIQDINWEILLYAVIMGLVIFSVGFVSSLLITKDPRKRGVVLQCSFRSNFAIIGLPLASALGDSAAVGVAALLSTVTIPLFNILAVFSLTIFLRNGGSISQRIKNILRNIVRNPLIIGVLSGIISLVFRQMQVNAFSETYFSLRGDLKFLYSAMSQLKSMTTPLALIVLGAQFEFSAVSGLQKEIVCGTLLRTVVAPALGIGTAALMSLLHIMPFGTHIFPSLVALFGSPVAVSSAIMAASMDNDDQLATQLVVWTSLFSIITIFIQVCILLYLGLLTV